MTLKLYFAHNFNDRFSARRTEKRIEARYDIELFNPFYDADRNDMAQLDELGEKRIDTDRQMKTWDINYCKELVERDLDAIRHCDGLLTIIKSASFGTSMEIIMTAYIYRMPVYIITKNKTVLSHPWLRYMVHISGGKMFNGKREFERWLKEVNRFTII